jgi:predicted nucleotidyltransferase
VEEALVEGASADSGVEVREEVAQVAVGSAGVRDLKRERKIAEFVSRMQGAAGTNLRSVVLYGSAASGEFDSHFSDINVLCLLGDASLPSLVSLAHVVRWWQKQARATPLFMTIEDLGRSADVFSIELLDLKSNYRMVYGQDDPVASLDIPMHLHRVQLEYELREKLVFIRRQLMLAAGDGKRTWNLLRSSLPAYATFFRHALIARGEGAPRSKRESFQALGAALGFDPSPFYVVLDVRERKRDLRDMDVGKIANEYLAAVEKVTSAVDRMLDVPSRSGS